MNASAMVCHNFNKAQGMAAGMYFFFDASAFTGLSMYWIKSFLFTCMVILFPNANIHYVDSDAVVWLSALQQRLHHLPSLSHNVLLGATDSHSPFNAGWICLYQADQNKASLQPAFRGRPREYLTSERLTRMLKVLWEKEERDLNTSVEGSVWTVDVDEAWQMSRALVTAVWSPLGLDLYLIHI